MNLCAFSIVETNGSLSRYRCLVCGRMTAWTKKSADFIFAECRDERLLEQRSAYVHCQHRGRVLVTLSAQTAGCGCSSTEANVYECEHFQEPVLKQSAARCLEKIRKKVQDYTGRTCWGCKIPVEALHPHVVHDDVSGWTH